LFNSIWLVLGAARGTLFNAQTAAEPPVLFLRDPGDAEIIADGRVGEADPAGLSNREAIGVDLRLPVHVRLAPVVEFPALPVLFDVAKLVDDIQVEDFVRRITKVGEGYGDRAVIVADENTVALIGQEYGDFCQDTVAIYRVGKEFGQDLITADIGKEVRQAVLTRCARAMNAKARGHGNGLWACRLLQRNRQASTPEFDASIYAESCRLSTTTCDGNGTAGHDIRTFRQGGFF